MWFFYFCYLLIGQEPSSHRHHHIRFVLRDVNEVLRPLPPQRRAHVEEETLFRHKIASSLRFFMRLFSNFVVTYSMIRYVPVYGCTFYLSLRAESVLHRYLCYQAPRGVGGAVVGVFTAGDRPGCASSFNTVSFFVLFLFLFCLWRNEKQKEKASQENHFLYEKNKWRFAWKNKCFLCEKNKRLLYEKNKWVLYEKNRRFLYEENKCFLCCQIAMIKRITKKKGFITSWFDE